MAEGQRLRVGRHQLQKNDAADADRCVRLLLCYLYSHSWKLTLGRTVVGVNRNQHPQSASSGVCSRDVGRELRDREGGRPARKGFGADLEDCDGQHPQCLCHMSGKTGLPMRFWSLAG